jgi:hypothetical protein
MPQQLPLDRLFRQFDELALGLGASGINAAVP